MESRNQTHSPNINPIARYPESDVKCQYRVDDKTQEKERSRRYLLLLLVVQGQEKKKFAQRVAKVESSVCIGSLGKLISHHREYRKLDRQVRIRCVIYPLSIPPHTLHDATTFSLPFFFP